jgi:Heavy metal binding domain
VRIILALLILLNLVPMSAQPPASAPTVPQDYVCPMDKDVRSDKPGFCPRCHMKLVLGIPDEVEYPLDLKLAPAVFHAGDKVKITFQIKDPHTGKMVDHFELVHDKLFHMFVVSEDLQYFLHDHPVPQPDGSFVFDMTFPKPGMYRIVGDLYPTGGTPQLIAKTVIVPGAPGAEVPLVDAKLQPELGVSHCKNMDVELVMDPPVPIVGLKTLLFFKITPADGLEQYLSSWAHMLVASDDTIDLVHDHPYIADGGPQMQFNIIFPRARTYRIWVQFQRKGVVNTAEFTIPVSELK